MARLIGALIGALVVAAVFHAYDIWDWLHSRDLDAECARLLEEQRARLWNDYSDL